MIHDGHLFDLPGRAFVYEVIDLDRVAAAVEAALRAVAGAVEPTVAEVVTERGVIHQLCGGDKLGGVYARQAERTVNLERIDADALVAWARAIDDAATLSIRDGWYRVAAREGDTIGIDSDRATVASRDGAAVRAPTATILLPPFGFTLDAASGRLSIAVHWSPWTDADGIGRARLDRVRSGLRGWKPRSEPAAEDLAWRRSPRPPPPVVPSSAGASRGVAWSRVAAGRVRLGLTADERERVADELLAFDRAAEEAETPLGYREYDAGARRAQIVAALAVSLGRDVVDVAAFELMRHPVSNAMWAAYMQQTGAARPTAWPSAGAPPDDRAVSGISQAEAAAFAAHHGWALPTEAQWQLGASVAAAALDGTCEYTVDRFAPYPGADPTPFAGARDRICARGSAPGLPPSVHGRRGLARDHRFRYARFRCVRNAG